MCSDEMGSLLLPLFYDVDVVASDLSVGASLFRQRQKVKRKAIIDEVSMTVSVTVSMTVSMIDLSVGASLFRQRQKVKRKAIIDEQAFF